MSSAGSRLVADRVASHKGTRYSIWSRFFIPRGQINVALAVFAVAFAIRMVLASQNIVYLDRLFLPDDTYYSLAIARNIAFGAGPSASGSILTNGFQPLITFLQVPFFWLGGGADQAARLAVMLSGFFGACGAATLAALLFRLADAPAAWIGGMIVALNPAIICNDLNGLETSLAMLINLAMLYQLLACMRSPTRWRRVVLGGIFGLSLLARIDSCFVAAIVAFFLVRHRGYRAMVWPAIAAAVVVLPWWLYSLHAVGGLIPESGAAVRQIVDSHLANDYGRPGAVGFAFVIVGRLLTGSYWPAQADTFAGAMLLAAMLIHGLRLRHVGGDRAVILRIMILGSAVYLAFYTLYLPAIWFFARYLQFVQFAVVAVAGVLLGDVWSAHRARVGRRRGIVAVVFAVVVVACWCVHDAMFLAGPSQTVDVGLQGAKGYREAALDVLRRVPAGATLGAMQSGALGYFAGPDVRVVNLDGVVNRGAYGAIRDRRLGQYMADEGVQYFADWPINVAFLAARFGQHGALPRLTLVYSAPAQGFDQFSLYRVGRQ